MSKAKARTRTRSRANVKKIVHPDLRLDGMPSDEVLGYLKTARKNIPVPNQRAGTGKWDHMINLLVDGMTVEMPHNRANSFASRARGLGYIIVIRKSPQKEGLSDVWFEGISSSGFKIVKRR